MTQGLTSLSYSFNINDVAFRATPVATAITNEFDYVGSLLGLPRLPEERNDSYKGRLLDVFVHRANSTYTGLVNGITRELNLDMFRPISISLKNGLDPSLTPRIEFKDSNVYIWSDVATQTLDMSFSRSDQAGTAYTIQGLVDTINTSSVFTAEVISSASSRADTILNTSSTKTILNQPLAPSRFNHLGNSNLERGSLVFSDTVTFRSEVSDIDSVSVQGQYFVDYATGLITSASAPSDASFIQYSFTQTPFVPLASPVIVRSVNGVDFQNVLFNQVVQADGTYTNGTPTIKGSQIINELMSVVPVYWGE